MKSLRLAALAAACFFTLELARPEPVQTVWYFDYCTLACIAASGGCTAVSGGDVNNCLIYLKGCLDGCNVA